MANSVLQSVLSNGLGWAHRGHTVQRATLLVIQGVEPGTRFELTEATVGIGRGLQNEVRLLDTEASRSHARIETQEGQFLLHDQGSSNGTFVNGRAVRVHTLRSGDQLQIGRSVLLFTREESFADTSDVSRHVTFLGPHGGEDRSSIVGQGIASDGHELHAQPHLSPEQTLAQTIANLQLLYHISEEVARPGAAIEETLQRILDLSRSATGADHGCMLLREPLTGEIIPRVFSPIRGATGAPMPVSRTIIDYVLRTRQGVRTSDAQTDRRFNSGQSILQGGIREAICIPMQGRYELTGVIYLDITTPPEQVLMHDGPLPARFTEELLRLMVSTGRQAALAIEDHRYRQALVKAERLGAVGQTIATLSHHIKNILQGVRGGSYLIDMGLRDHNEEVVRKGWKIVDKNQTKIYNLVMDMLTFSKERQPLPQVASVNETVSEVCELMQTRADEAGAQLDVRLDPRLPMTAFDPDGIHRAVLNLVTNACDAVEGHDHAKITVTTGFDADTKLVFVSVADTGSGIPPEVIPRLFNVFESTKGARGTGLGLAVTQKIVREHGGDISVDSTPGQGARFTLSWPLMDEERPRDSVTLA